MVRQKKIRRDIKERKKIRIKIKKDFIKNKVFQYAKSI